MDFINLGSVDNKKIIIIVGNGYFFLEFVLVINFEGIGGICFLVGRILVIIKYIVSGNMYYIGIDFFGYFGDCLGSKGVNCVG